MRPLKLISNSNKLTISINNYLVRYSRVKRKSDLREISLLGPPPPTNTHRLISINTFCLISFSPRPLFLFSDLQLIHFNTYDAFHDKLNKTVHRPRKFSSHPRLGRFLSKYDTRVQGFFAKIMDFREHFCSNYHKDVPTG